MTSRTFTAVILLLAAARTVPAQTPGGADHDEDALVALRAVARAQVKAVRAAPRELAIARLGAALEYQQARWKEFVAGKTTAEYLVDGFRLLAEAERGVHDQDAAAQEAALERVWISTREAERIARARYEAASFPILQYVESQIERLEAEIAWAGVRADGRIAAAAFLAEDGPENAEDLLDWSRGVARDRRAATATNVNQLRAQLVTAAREGVEVRYREFVAGRLFPTLYLDGVVRLALAERELQGKTGGAEWLVLRWDAARMMFELARAHYEASNVPLSGYAAARYALLDAELELVRATAGKPTPRVLTPPASDPGSAEAVEFLSRDHARARFALSRADVKQLAADRVAVAAEGWKTSLEEFLAGKSVSNFPLLWSTRLLESELALADDRSHQLRAYADHWRRTRVIEAISLQRYESGTVAITQYANTRYHRLDAELKLVRALAR
jgi:hypothetical protein